jgi:Asp/Glu/hydantoin racemase
MHGLGTRCAGIRALGESFKSISGVQAEKEDALVRLANLAVDEDGADVVILSGAPLAGLADKIKDRIPVPAIDPIAAAVRQAETLAVLKLRKAVAGSFRRPDPKPTTGLAESLAAVIEHRDGKREGTN